MEENMPLVAAIARRYRNCGLVQEDMLQLGSIGLLQALRRFNPDRGLCFSTYAVPLIAGEIRRFLRDDGMVKFSREAKSLAIQIERVRREQGDLTVEQLSAQLQVPLEDITAALASREGALSLDTPTEEDGADLQSFLGSANADTERDSLQRVELKELFSQKELFDDSSFSSSRLSALQEENAVNVKTAINIASIFLKFIYLLTSLRSVRYNTGASSDFRSE